MIKHRIDMWRFYEELERIDKKIPPKHCTLFLGSSTFAHYVKIEDDFKDYNAINAGFGGSTSDEALFHYERIVNKFNPDILVFYNGDNEPVCGYSLKETIYCYKTIFDKYHKEYPNGRIIIVGTKSSFARKEYYDYVQSLNKWEKNFADKHYYCDYISTKDIYYKDNDYNFDMLCDDKLHFNDLGNELLHKKIVDVIESKRKLTVDISKIVDNNEFDIQKYSKIMFYSTLIYIALTLSVLFISNNDYTINLLINAFLTIIYVFLMVYIIRDKIYYLKKRRLYFSLASNSDVFTEELTYKSCISEFDNDGVIVRKLKFIDSSNNERDLYNLKENPLYLVENKKYTIKSLSNLIVELK